MLYPITFMDMLLAGLLPPVACVILWALISAAISMCIYARLAPQESILNLKAEQKASRKQLLAFDGEFDEMMPLIRHNMHVSLKLIGISLLPVLVATLPILWIMAGLYERYGEQLFFADAPAWAQGFDLLYIVVLVIASLATKFFCKIA